MNKILILGAGMVAKPIVRYLLEKGNQVTVADMVKTKAEEIVAGHPHGHTVQWSTENTTALSEMVAANDIVVSLLPYAYHVMVAEKCIENKKNMVTTSYVKPAMYALDGEAKKAGVIILNEIGLDPGIDHMSAMRIIDHIHDKGGTVEEFYSICGALPAPEACNNPMNYRFSWSPKGVVLAGNNDAKYLKNGHEVNIPTENLFKNPLKIYFPSLGMLDVYPNRDSMSYIDIYKVPGVKTMFRGTFRYTGWCETLDAIKALKLISDEKHDFTGKSYAGMMAMLTGEGSTGNQMIKTAQYLGVPVDSTCIRSMEWLGLFSDEPMNRGVDTTFEITSDLMISKMMLGPKERDMVVMQHTFVASWPDGKKEVIKSSMLDYGIPGRDTAIARTVALPAAIGVEMILTGQITLKGVHIPVVPGIYNPVLDQLEKLGIKMTEEYGLPLSEKIG